MNDHAATLHGDLPGGSPTGTGNPGCPESGDEALIIPLHPAADAMRPVIELGFGILVYPPESDGEPWRATFTERVMNCPQEMASSSADSATNVRTTLLTYVDTTAGVLRPRPQGSRIDTACAACRRAPHAKGKARPRATERGTTDE